MIFSLTIAGLGSSDTESWTSMPESVRAPLSEVRHLIFMALVPALISYFFLLWHLLCRIINMTLLCCLHIHTYSWFWYGYSLDNELFTFNFSPPTPLFSLLFLPPPHPAHSTPLLSLPYHSFWISFAFTHPNLPPPPPPHPPCVSLGDELNM